MVILLLIPNIGVGAWWGPVYGGVQGLVPPAMRALSAAVLLFVINMIGLGGGPTAFGMTTDAMTNHYLAGTGFDVQTCRTAVDAAKATCAAASAHGIKTVTASISPPRDHSLWPCCASSSAAAIKKDVANAEIMPSTPISTRRLSAYLFVAEACPGAASLQRQRFGDVLPLTRHRSSGCRDLDRPAGSSGSCWRSLIAGRQAQAGRLGLPRRSLAAYQVRWLQIRRSPCGRPVARTWPL